jgi:signal transduction histidine kinase
VTLTNRLLLFVLALLACVLTGFSVTMYVLADRFLQEQAEDRLCAALDTLVAAAEIGSNGVRWDSDGRSISVGPRSPREQLSWVVTNQDGRLVASSGDPTSTELLREAVAQLSSGNDAWKVEVGSTLWQVDRRWVHSNKPRKDIGRQEHGNHQDGEATGARDGDGESHQGLAIVAALSMEPAKASLRQLAIALSLISATVLGAALVAGRFVCKRVLSPVRRMADEVRQINPNDQERRLPTPVTADEVADLGNSFNGLLDRLHEALERQRRFTGDAAHQLRTPLDAVLGHIEVALRRPRTVEELEKVLGTVHARAKHLQRIVQALLFLARADASTTPPGSEAVDLAALVADQLQSWKEHVRFQDIHCEDSASPLVAHANPTLTGEIFNVFIDNACKYSPDGSPITVRLVQGSGEVRLEVVDSGQGIDPADLGQVFSPFFRASSALRVNKAGVGLGLSIARRLAECMGGRLEVASQTGSGSKFTLILPACERVPKTPEVFSTSEVGGPVG